MAELNALNIFGDNLTIKQLFFDTSHPIGSTYTQYPQQDSPQTLFDNAGVTSTWKVVNYDGAFFRAQGTNAKAFIEKTGVLSKQSQSTAKNGLTFTGTPVTSGANNRGHTHSYAHTHEYTPSGSVTTDDIEMKGETSLSNWNPGWNDGSGVFSHKNRHDNAKHSTDGTHEAWNTLTFYNKHNHPATFSGSTGTTTSQSTTTSDGESQNHTHSVTAAGTISGDTETRPINYTIRVWKRTA